MRYGFLSPHMDELQRRLWAASEALALSHGGVAAVAEATGLSRVTVASGVRELRAKIEKAAAGVADTTKAEPPVVRRIRRPGGGRKRIADHVPGIKDAIEKLVDPVTRGDPMSPLRWTTKSTTQLSKALKEQGIIVSHQVVGELLHEMGYSLQANRKTREGASHADRNEQFEYINDRAVEHAQQHQPVISVDTKKKEQLGPFKNGGREWQPKGQPEEVLTHDFPSDAVGKAIPYGVYDFYRNEAWVNVGIDHDTGDFAVASILSWWQNLGKEAYPAADRIMITADCGGSNGYRLRLWKVALQRLANATGLAVSVCHLPPGTSKWNKIEHRLFCHITRNWRGRPLLSHEIVVSTIKSTTTTKGLRVGAVLDERTYPAGIHVEDEELAGVNLTRATFHGEWNYTIRAAPKVE